MHNQRQWVIPHWTGNYMITVNPVGGVTAVEQKATAQVLFVLLNEFRNGDRRARSLISDIHRALCPESSSLFAPLTNGVRESETRARVAEAVEHAALTGRLSLVADVRPIAYVAPQVVAPPLGPSQTASSSELHFIELELVDQEEKPVGSEPYSIKLPDGRTVTGRLDRNGRATVRGIKDPGACQVSFPNLDASVWA